MTADATPEPTPDFDSTDVEPVRAGTPSDNTTVTAIIDELERDGYTASFGARDGARLHCSACRQESPAAAYVVAATRRVEGASDPDAAAIVIAGTCPQCGAEGTVVLAYGPDAGEVDGLVVAELDLRS